MKKAMTILCSIAFAISGITMALHSGNISPGVKGNTIAAAPMPHYVFPKVQLDTCTLDIPEDLIRDLAKRKGVLDTVYVTKTDTIKEQVTKVKWKKIPASSPVMEINVTASHRTDTIQVPVYYLATQVGNKEGPTGECISVYEVHKVDEICPDTTISSVELSNE